MPPSPASRPRWIAGALVLVALLGIALLVADSTDDVDARTDGAAITCDATAIYGHDVSCSLTNAPANATIDWGDGTLAPADTTAHPIRAVGAAIPVRLLHGRVVIAQTTVAVDPDIAIECTKTVDELQPVYELAAAVGDVRDVWDYVYEDADGTRVAPGDVDHPTDPGLTTDYSPVVVDMVQRTGDCFAISDALDDLDGDVWWEVEGEWFDTITIRFRNPLIHMKGRWSGVQPGTATVFVEINDQQVSERIGVYSSGCT
ncbi:MAG: hypothetical protein DHS20C19_06290 [Acidimicrobiales bacterium]|nr:MAG: hypothetical protein DHS20C19_06290 [Acidimicrobiales bacterium]